MVRLSDWRAFLIRKKGVTYDLSLRYGYFRKHTKDWEGGQVLQLGMSYNAERLETTGIGDRTGPNMHLQVFGLVGAMAPLIPICYGR